MDKHRDASICTKYSEKRLSLWEEVMRKFSESQKGECRTLTASDMPRVKRSVKHFPTGSKYEGTWDVLGMGGYGTYTFPNGVIYEGELEDGMFHGKGELRYPNGAVLKATWKKGQVVERKLMFANGLEYTEEDWAYCRMPDRRFTIEYSEGLQPAGRSFMTADQPTREIPPGYYDTGDGFYDPKTKVVYKPDDLSAILRSPHTIEQNWILANCRTAPVCPTGPKPQLYERWVEPQEHPEVLPSPPKAPLNPGTSDYVKNFHVTPDVEVEMSIKGLVESDSSGSIYDESLMFPF